MKNELSIIIPTYNNTYGLKKLLNYFKIKKYPLIIIDNQPTNEKLKLIQLFSTNSNQLNYLPQSTNLGFAAAINRGVKKIKTKWFVILNDDVEISDINIFEKLLHFAKKNNLMAVSPVLKKPSGQIENLGYQILPIGRIKLITNYNHLQLFSTNSNYYIDGLTAACLLIKTEVFKKLGGFDERFFTYLEDADFFLRLKKILATEPSRFDKIDKDRTSKVKFAFTICPEVFVLHHHMSTSKTIKGFKEWHDFKNWILIILKNWNKKTLLFNLPGIIIERLRNLSGLFKSYLK